MRIPALILLALVLLVAPVAADTVTTWDVQYSLRGDISQEHHFYGLGSYLFLLTPNYITVYTVDKPDGNFGWLFLGMYGQPFGSYPQAVLPDSMPAIVFPIGTDMAGAEPHTMMVPEPATLLLVGAGIAGVALVRRRWR